MKPVSPQLLALLKQAGDGELEEVETYQFLLNGGGGYLRYTDGPIDLTVNGRVYSAGGTVGPFFNRSGNEGRVHLKNGMDVDTLVFEVAPGSALVQGLPFLVACSIGLFEAAEVTLQKIFMPSYGDTRMGPLTMFVGRIAELDIGRTSAVFNIDSHLELLTQPFPRNIFQPGCINSLGDAACTVDLTQFQLSLATIAGSTGGLIAANFAASPIGRYDQGKVTYTTGANAGLSRTVKTSLAGSPGSITLLAPFPLTPGTGDLFTMSAGCNKSFTDANGCPKFSNTANWRGFDLIPTPETAV